MGDVNCRVITLLLGNLWMVDSLGGAYSRRVMPGAAGAGGDGVTRGDWSPGSLAWPCSADSSIVAI